jgi:hypothetical protein
MSKLSAAGFAEQKREELSFIGGILNGDAHTWTAGGNVIRGGWFGASNGKEIFAADYDRLVQLLADAPITDHDVTDFELFVLLTEMEEFARFHNLPLGMTAHRRQGLGGVLLADEDGDEEVD